MRLLPERRQHPRIVTLKNAVWLFVALSVLFIAVSAWNELRPPDPSRERLSERGRAGTTPAAKSEPAETIEEQPISDDTFTARRGAFPLALPPPPPPAAIPAAPPGPPPRITLKQSRQRGERVAITGGAEGVRVETTPATPPVPPDRF